MHSIMFHHFHGGSVPASQGSLSAEQLHDLLSLTKKNSVVLDASDFLAQVSSGRLRDKEISITFDDGLKCQFDFALPVLSDLKIQAFFFIPTGPISGEPNKFEITRHVKNHLFDDIDEFYDEFFAALRNRFPDNYSSLIKAFRADYLSHLTFYSYLDRRFKFARDEILSDDQYLALFQILIEKYEFCAPQPEAIWMSARDITTLHEKGHLVGLHSHSHSSKIDTFPYERQREEYSQNQRILERLLNTTVTSVSYPLGRLNKDTLGIMTELGVSLGFRNAIYNQERALSNALKMPRCDPSYASRALDTKVLG